MIKIYRLITPDGIEITRKAYQPTHLHYALLYRENGLIWHVRWFKLYDSGFRRLLYLRRNPKYSEFYLVPVTEYYAVKADDPDLPPYPHEILPPVAPGFFNPSGHKIPTALLHIWTRLARAAERENQIEGLARFTPQAYDEYRLLRAIAPNYERVLRIALLYYQAKHGYEDIRDLLTVARCRLAGMPTSKTIQDALDLTDVVLESTYSLVPKNNPPLAIVTLHATTFYPMAMWLQDTRIYLILHRRLQKTYEQIHLDGV